jgi:hypothetical protein
MELLLQLATPQEQLLPLLQPTLAQPLLLPHPREHIRAVLSGQAGGWATGGTTGVVAGSSSRMEDSEDKGLFLSQPQFTISTHPELNECYSTSDE